MSVASRTIFVQYHPMKEESLVQFKLMLPSGLKARVESVAKENRRSLSQEIVATLEDAYPAPAPETNPALQAFISEHLSKAGISGPNDPRYTEEMLRAVLTWTITENFGPHHPALKSGMLKDWKFSEPGGT